MVILAVAAGALPLPTETGPAVWWLAGVGMAAALLEGPRVAPALIVAFTAVGVGTLALGIGSTTARFALVHAAPATSDAAGGAARVAHEPALHVVTVSHDSHSKGVKGPDNPAPCR